VEPVDFWGALKRALPFLFFWIAGTVLVFWPNADERKQ